MSSKNLEPMVKMSVAEVRIMHGEMVLESELRGKDWVSKSEYLSFLKREHYDLWRTVISMLAADEAVEGESGPLVPEAVIPLGWHPPVRTMSRRWRRNTLRVSNGP